MVRYVFRKGSQASWAMGEISGGVAAISGGDAPSGNTKRDCANARTRRTARPVVSDLLFSQPGQLAERVVTRTNSCEEDKK